MLRPLQRMPGDVAARLAAEAAQHPAASARARFEAWYLKRWHCLPEGYLSQRSVGLYDAVIRRLYSCGREAAAARFVSEECDRIGARELLEIGPGSGSLLARVVAASPDIGVAAADLSPFCVERTAARLPASARGRHSVVHGDARSLPWPDGSFDVVLASHVLGHVPADVAHGIAVEARRVLRPGGRFIVVDHAWHAVEAPGMALARKRTLAGGVVVARSMRPSQR